MKIKKNNKRKRLKLVQKKSNWINKFERAKDENEDKLLDAQGLETTNLTKDSNPINKSKDIEKFDEESLQSTFKFSEEGSK